MSVVIYNYQANKIQNAVFDESILTRETARVLEYTLLPDEGWDDEILYVLDNGMCLCFKWFDDPFLATGEEISLVKNPIGIEIRYRDSLHVIKLFGDPEGRFFQAL